MLRQRLWVLMVCAGLVFGPPGSARGETAAGFPAVKGPCSMVFPEDHGPHPAYRTEWWYYTGHVASADGRRFGYQWTVFRHRTAPGEVRAAWDVPPSAWRSHQVFLAHRAVSDLDRGRFVYAERILRGALGMAGARQIDGRTTVEAAGSSLTIGPRKHRLKGEGGGFAVDLALIPAKRPILHGRNGYSRKGSTPERASCYYSLTRLTTEGTLTIGGVTHRVRGLSWMDQEYSSAALEPGLRGWDWFGLQLSDQTELMIYLLRQADGGFSAASSGTFVAASGDHRHLRAQDMAVEILDDWKSPHSGATYPAGWRIRVDGLDLDLRVHPSLADQELQTPRSTGITYWEGSVSIRGTAAGRTVDGSGYAELTGYARPFDGPL